MLPARLPDRAGLALQDDRVDWTLFIAWAGLLLSIVNAWRSYTQPTRQRQAEHRKEMRAVMVELRAGLSGLATQLQGFKMPEALPEVLKRVETWVDNRNAPPVKDGDVQRTIGTLTASLFALEAIHLNWSISKDSKDVAAEIGKQDFDEAAYQARWTKRHQEMTAQVVDCIAVVDKITARLDRLD